MRPLDKTPDGRLAVETLHSIADLDRYAADAEAGGELLSLPELEALGARRRRLLEDEVARARRDR